MSSKLIEHACFLMVVCPNDAHTLTLPLPQPRACVHVSLERCLHITSLLMKVCKGLSC